MEEKELITAENDNEETVETGETPSGDSQEKKGLFAFFDRLKNHGQQQTDEPVKEDIPENQESVLDDHPWTRVEYGKMPAGETILAEEDEEEKLESEEEVYVEPEERRVGLFGRKMIPQEEPEEEKKGLFKKKEKTEKKKRKFGFSNVLIILYLLYHIAYTAYMFTFQWTRGLAWLGITLAELLIFTMIMTTQKKLYYLGRLFSLIFALVLVFNTAFSGFILLKSNSRQSGNADYILVLGSRLENNEMTVFMKDILSETIVYMQENTNTIAVLCGGVTKGNTESEANVMRKYLINAGIPESRLILEDNSTDTIQNIHNAKQYISSGKKIVVITADFNAYRAQEICRQEGINVKTVGATTPIAYLPDRILHEKVSLIKLLVSR